MKIVTSGSTYIDIDAYACAVAYAELLRAKGFEARAYSSAVINESVCGTVQSWPGQIDYDKKPSPEDTYTLVDLSDPNYFDPVVDIAKIDEVIDHHVGFEHYWQERIGDNACIEFIGAASTLVYERWVKANLLKLMSQTSARLLVCGILDNTLNFGAVVTTQRDMVAYKALEPIANLPDDWPEQYFSECESSILADPVHAMENDAKTVSFTTYEQPVLVSQMTVWDASKVISEHLATILNKLSVLNPHWFANIISVSEGKSYFIANNTDIKSWLHAVYGVVFEDSVAVANRLWLRKEIIKHDLQILKNLTKNQ